jgi:threonyl-tRNA synthetase
MERIVRENQRFVRRVVEDEARELMADEPFKLELIGLAGGPGAGRRRGASVEVGAGELTIYDNVNRDGETVWRDLCRGPTCPAPARRNGWDLTRIAGAYWRGSEKNPQLQRIYGTAWPTKDELRLPAAPRGGRQARPPQARQGARPVLVPRRDRPGLSVFHPKGGIIRYEIERYMRERLLASGYEVVNTPHITKGDLFMTSGHLQWYADGMFPPMVLDEVVDADGTSAARARSTT